MSSFYAARNLSELKHQYRKLAARYHPDKGGDLETMQAINAEYHRRHLQLKDAANDAPPLIEDFSSLRIGDTIFVNGTKCEVLEVGEFYFRVVAIGRSRQAQISKQSGRGRFNIRLRASFHKNDRAYYAQQNQGKGEFYDQKYSQQNTRTSRPGH